MTRPSATATAPVQLPESQAQAGSPASYPVFLHLATFSVLIAGLGKVGQRKLSMLLACHPRQIHILETGGLEKTAQELVHKAADLGIPCTVSRRTFAEKDLAGVDLVFACTGDHALNRTIAELCQTYHILCNCTDNPALGSFHVPAVARTPSLAVALSTEQASPALSRIWKAELKTWLAPKEPMVRLMGLLRQEILALGQDADSNAEIFRALAKSPLQEALAARDVALVMEILAGLLPELLYESREAALQAFVLELLESGKSETN